MIRALPALSLLLALAPAASGCAENALRTADVAGAFGDDDDDEIRGQTILFVGTDPATLQTDLYLAQAVAPEGGFGDEGPDATEAESFAVSRLTDLSIGGSSSPLENEADGLFSDDQPFPVPDRDGRRVAMMATARDPDSGYSSGGRVAVLDVDFADLTIGDDVEGLRSVHWSGLGGALLLERDVPGDPSRGEILLQDDAGALSRLGPETDTATHTFAGLETGTDRFLLHERDFAEGTTDVWRVDPLTGDAELLTGGIADRVDHPLLDPTGRWLAMARSRPESELRAVIVVDLEGGADAEPWLLGDDAVDDCFWPSWSPPARAKDPTLVFVCKDAVSERPDLMAWRPATPETAPFALTVGAQPDIFLNTFDGLVIRSAPQWDPTGGYVVFGASTEDETLNGGGTTLLGLPIPAADELATAYPIWSGDEGSAGWAHFSATSSAGNLLLWDRSATGLQDSSGSHPIQIVPADDANQPAVPVALGQDLLVTHPLFLGGNTMLYP